ncbi:MAG: 30S ribosomal protein S19e [Candidatus Woesearchaeota archaeon]
MVNIYDVDPNQLIVKAGEELKKVSAIQPPKWSSIVKTGVHKERPPANKDWWYVRAAAVLRSLYKLGPVGVSKLRKKYGGRQNRGFKPEKFKPASGNILRKVLQQLEKAGLARQTQVGNMKGRVVTPKGKSFLDKVAAQMYVKHVPMKETETEVKEQQ